MADIDMNALDDTPRDTRLASARRSGAWGSGLDFCFDLRGKLEPWPILAMLGWQLLYRAWGSGLDSCFNLRQNLEPWPPLAMLDWQQEEGLGFGSLIWTFTSI